VTVLEAKQGPNQIHNALSEVIARGDTKGANDEEAVLSGSDDDWY
jgi:hypothetical protein